MSCDLISAHLMTDVLRINDMRIDHNPVLMKSAHDLIAHQLQSDNLTKIHLMRLFVTIWGRLMKTARCRKTGQSTTNVGGPHEGARQELHMSAGPTHSLGMS